MSHTNDTRVASIHSITSALVSLSKYTDEKSKQQYPDREVCSWIQTNSNQDTKEQCVYKAIPGIVPATCLYHTRLYITNISRRLRDVIHDKISDAEFMEIVTTSKNIQSSVDNLVRNPAAEIKIEL